MSRKRNSKRKAEPMAMGVRPIRAGHPKGQPNGGRSKGRSSEQVEQVEGTVVSAGQFYAVLGVLSLVTLWSYWPTFVWMEDQWRNEPDYSHGYLVGPLAALILYLRWDVFPGWSGKIYWGGFGLLVLGIALRIVGRLTYVDFLDGWTLALWVAGIVWIFAGTKVLFWALPGICFLLLLVPLPYRMETLLSWRLQGLATSLSAGLLQIFGFPAIAEGHTIWLDDRQSLVEEACSGMRIFVGMGAMGYVFAVLARRAWIDKFVILAVALPIAVFVNVLRVSGTVVAFHWLSEEHAKAAHDWFGVLMIVVGAAILGLVKVFWEKLYRPVEVSLSQTRFSRPSLIG